MHLIAYTSEYCGDDSRIDIEIAAIVEKSQRTNHTNSITGIMYHHNGRFLQFLEGSESSVRQTMSRIRLDSRHKNVDLLFDDPIAERGFPHWSMDCFNLTGDKSIDNEQLEHVARACRSNFKIESGSFIAELFKDVLVSEINEMAD